MNAQTCDAREILAEILAELPRKERLKLNESVLIVKLDCPKSPDDCVSLTHIIPRAIALEKLGPRDTNDRIGAAVHAELRRGQNVLLFDARNGSWQLASSRVRVFPGGKWEVA